MGIGQDAAGREAILGVAAGEGERGRETVHAQLPELASILNSFWSSERACLQELPMAG